jgi:hypothetical protein
LNIIIFLSFIILYVYPFQANKATNYPLYFYFNAILFADFIIKIFLSISLIFYYIFNRQQTGRKFLYAGIIISTGVFLTIGYGVIVGQQTFRITKIELEFDNLPSAFHNYKIVQISDTHVGSYLKTNNCLQRTARTIDKINPDMLLFTGDLINNYASEIYSWEEPFREITANVKSYSVLGNHDYGDYTKWETPQKKQRNFEEILDEQNKIGFHLLRNENVVIKEEHDSIFLVGVENWGHPPFPQYADLEKAMTGIPDSAFAIFMTHDPAHWEVKAKDINQIKLAFSGHTHGLQWGIKPAGIVFSLIAMTRINWGGIYHSDNSVLVVNTGLGTIGVPWRIDMPPELTLVTLKRSEIY